MRQTNAAATIGLFKKFFNGIAAPALPFGCSATLRSLSHCFQLIRHSSRQLPCPSCRFVHFALRSAPFHHVRSYAVCYKAGHPTSNAQELSKAVMHLPFRKSHATILTGFHSTPLRPAFTSAPFRPLAAHIFRLPTSTYKQVLFKKMKCIKDRCSTCKDIINC